VEPIIKCRGGGYIPVDVQLAFTFGDSMEADRDELIFTVPADMMRRCKGLAIDIGM
jgi:hypothetical protein